MINIVNISKVEVFLSVDNLFFHTKDGETRSVLLKRDYKTISKNPHRAK